MNQDFIYKNADKIDALIEDLKNSPDMMVKVPLGKQKMPLLDRSLIALGVFNVVDFVLFLVFGVFLTMFSNIIDIDFLRVLWILSTLGISFVLAIFAFFKFNRRDEYKSVRVEDLTYYDLARIVAQRYHLSLDEAEFDVDEAENDEDDISSINESDVDESTLDGVIYWMRRVQGKGNIVQGSEAYDNLENSIRYLTNLKTHENYQPNNSILEGMAETLKNYDRLVSQEIPIPRVQAVLHKIESVLGKYENVCKQMYEDAIENDLLETEVQLDSVNSQVELKGLAEDDFFLDPLSVDEQPLKLE